ncbi:MAG TPA: hypothetical protein VHJ79_22640, partial [Mycobacterium sp.]|nr:hypothetical protein [Mycobacterium sp.]
MGDLADGTRPVPWQHGVALVERRQRIGEPVKGRTRMEPTRLDRIAIALGRRGSRRVLLSTLTNATAGTTLAALVTVPGREEAAAACLAVGQVCTSSKQCCRHKHKRRICAANPQINDAETTCCIP